jgi:hypothetical protein
MVLFYQLDEAFRALESRFREQSDLFLSQIRSVHVHARERCDSEINEVIGQAEDTNNQLEVLEKEMQSFTRQGAIIQYFNRSGQQQKSGQGRR